MLSIFEGDAVKKLRKLAAWCLSPEGRKDIGAFVAAVTAIYTAIHRAGV